MFEKFLSMNEDTFRTRYEGTYGFFRKANKEKLLVRLVQIRGGVCIFHDINGQEYRLNADAKEDIGFLFIPPKAIYYNTKDGEVFLVNRIAQRQFSRGLNDRNTSIRKMSKLGLSSVGVSFHTLDKIYSQITTPQEAYKEWDKRGGVAIADYFCLGTKTGTIYLYDKTIGAFAKKDNHFECRLDEPNLWRTELTDAFTSVGCTTNIA